jgi:hypothetical protein
LSFVLAESASSCPNGKVTPTFVCLVSELCLLSKLG